MHRLIPLLPLLLAACVSPEGSTRAAAPFGFVGTWDCAGAPLLLTDSTYSFQGRDARIRSVTKSNADHTLRMTVGSLVVLAALTDNGVTHVASGAQVNCRRAN